MKMLARPLARLFLPVAFIFVTGSAHAAPRTWVSGAGTDTGNCTRGAPCKSFWYAITKTDAGGELSVIDSADYVSSGQVVAIDKSISIVAEGAEGGLTFGQSQVSIGLWLNGSPGTIINLRGLTLDGLRSGNSGILVGSGISVNIENCVVKNWFIQGLYVVPDSAAKIAVSNTTFINNGVSNQGGAIIVNPTTGGTAQVALERVLISNNVFGIAADGSGSTGGINMTIADSVMTGNTNDGVVATSSAGHAPSGVAVVNSKLLNNGFGTRSLGNNVTVRLDGSKVIGNGTGVSASSGGALLSAGNNIVEANATNGAFTGPITLK